MKKLVTINLLILIFIVINIFYASHAIKLVDDDYLKAGILSDVLENKKVLAVSPCKLFKSTAVDNDDIHILLKKDLEEIFEKSNIEITTVKNKNGKLYNEETAIGTGAVATSKDDEKYTIVLYGDANGDGRICNTMDIEVIRQDYVFNNKAEEEYKLAADLQADGTLNVRDVQLMVKKYIGELDESVVNPFPEDEEIDIIKPEITVEITTNEDEVTIKSIVTNLEEIEKYSKIKNYRYNLQKFNGITYENVLNGNIETEEPEYTYSDLDDGEYVLTAVAITENGIESDLTEKSFVISKKQAKLEITDYSKTSITVVASIEEDEISSVKHYYRVQSESAQNSYNEWLELENITTAEYIYTTKELTEGLQYQFKAEITTTDEKIYETNIVNWVMGEEGVTPQLNMNTTIDEDEATISVEVTNITEVEQYSKIKNYSYRITKKIGDTYEDIENGSVTTKEAQYTFKELTDGDYVVSVVAETEREAKSEPATKSFTIKKTVAKIEIIDYTKDSITVKANIEEKEIASVKHMYRTQPVFSQSNVDAWSEVADATTAKYVYTTKELTNNWSYQFKAEITTTDGKVFETDIANWLMGYIGPNPDVTVTATINENTATVKVEVTNDVIVNQYSYLLQKQDDNGKSYSSLGEAIKTESSEYTFEELSDGKYQVVVVASNSKGAYITKFVGFTIKTLDEGETLDESEAVAQVESTGKMYKTLQYAINATIDENKDTVTILKDINTSEKVEVNKTITVNLNGKTVNSYFKVTNTATISDNTLTPGIIDLSNDTINPAISVIENGSLTLNNGVNIKAHTIGIECIGENSVVNIIKANIEETYLSEYETDYSAIKVVDGGSLYIKDGDNPAEVNLISDRYAIYANNASIIEVNNNQEQKDDGFLYEVYGDISSIYAYNNIESATEIKIAGGRFTTYSGMGRTVISTNGKINLETTGGIIGNLETGKGIAGNPIKISANQYYIPNFKINGTTKVFANYYGIYIGGSRYNIPNVAINLEIGTDDNGESKDGVQIEASSTGVYLATLGGVEAVIGGTDTSYSGDNSNITTNGGHPIIKGYNASGLGVGIQSFCDKDNSHLIINCRAIIFGNSKCLDGFGYVYTWNHQAYTIVKGDENDEGIITTSPVLIRATYLKNR